MAGQCNSYVPDRKYEGEKVSYTEDITEESLVVERVPDKRRKERSEVMARPSSPFPNLKAVLI